MTPGERDEVRELADRIRGLTVRQLVALNRVLRDDGDDMHLSGVPARPRPDPPTLDALADFTDATGIKDDPPRGDDAIGL